MFAFGMAATLFMAGMELEFERIRGRPLRLAVGGWAMSVALGLSAAAVLHASSLHDPMIVALALTTTAFGTLLPILRDAGRLDTPFGRLFIAAGTMGGLGRVSRCRYSSAAVQWLAGVWLPDRFPRGRDLGGCNQLGTTAAARSGASESHDAHELAASSTRHLALVCCLFRTFGAIRLREHSGRVCRGMVVGLATQERRKSAADED